MKILKLGILTTLLLFYFSNLSAKCDCKGNEIITVCQNGVTKRVNCSAQSSPNVFCGPCEKKPNCTPGTRCNDYNDCTVWDMYDNNCNCFGRFADEDDDGVCDAKDICPDGDDLKDKDKNGMPDDCENRPPPSCSECEADGEGIITICWIPLNKDKLQTVKANCEWLTNFFTKEGKLKGKSECGPCKCEYVDDADSDGDGVCDREDECPNDAGRSVAGPCGCEDCPDDGDSLCDDPCQPQGDSEFEWIDKISMNQLENQSGDDGGYGDYRHMVLELGQGDSLSLWLFPDFLEQACVLSAQGYVDWNGDCDFDDAGELVFDNRTSGENGKDIAIPFDASVGDLTVRFIIHNGRLKSACQECIDGEVEDYTLRVFSRNGINKPTTVKNPELRKSILRVFPNPIFENDVFVVKLGKKEIIKNELTVFNSSGELVLKRSLAPGETEFTAETMQAGVYIFELKNDLGTFRQKIIVTK